jgi:hypothetical protein
LTATLCTGHRDLPVFFDALNDALEARDAEEYGRIAGAKRALLDRRDDKEEAELICWRKRGGPEIKMASK